jgi:hypothetical protein
MGLDYEKKKTDRHIERTKHDKTRPKTEKLERQNKQETPN